MNVHNVFCDSLNERLETSSTLFKTGIATNAIAPLVMLILDDEDHVKTRQDRGLEINVLKGSVSTYEYICGWKRQTSPGLLPSSYRPHIGFAAARTLVRELRIVVIPALAIDIVCCSIAS